jgi:type II secretion system protein H
LRTSTAKTEAPGFTLLEVVVVLAIFALAAGIVLPRLGDLGARRLEDAARRLADAATLARERAILGGAPTVLVLDLDRGRWRAEDTASVPLPSGVRFRDVVTPDGVRAWRGALDLAFDATGDASARVDLADANGRVASVVLPAGGGRATVIRP